MNTLPQRILININNLVKFANFTNFKTTDCEFSIYGSTSQLLYALRAYRRSGLQEQSTGSCSPAWSAGGLLFSR